MKGARYSNTTRSLQLTILPARHIGSLLHGTNFEREKRSCLRQRRGRRLIVAAGVATTTTQESLPRRNAYHTGITITTSDLSETLEGHCAWWGERERCTPATALHTFLPWPTNR